MAIEADLRTHLVNDTDVNNIVGTRVYPLKLPQTAELPAISFQRISADRAKSVSQGSIGHATPRIQLDCWARSYSAVKNLATKVRLALDTFTGNLGGGSYVQHVSLEGESDGFEEGTEFIRVSLDFMISYNE